MGGAPTNKEKTMQKKTVGKWYSVRIKGMRVTLWARSKKMLKEYVNKNYHNGQKAAITELV